MSRTFFFNSLTKYSVGNRRWGRTVPPKGRSIRNHYDPTADRFKGSKTFFSPNVYDAQIDSMWISWLVRCQRKHKCKKAVGWNRKVQYSLNAHGCNKNYSLFHPQTACICIMHVLAGPFQRVFLDTRYKREYRFAQFLRDAGDSFFFFFFFSAKGSLRKSVFGLLIALMTVAQGISGTDRAKNISRGIIHDCKIWQKNPIKTGILISVGSRCLPLNFGKNFVWLDLST